MTNMEVLINTENYELNEVLNIYHEVEKISGRGLVKEAIDGLYSRPADYFDIVNFEIDSKYLLEVKALFQIGMLNENKFGTPEIDRNNWKNYLVGLSIRRDMKKSEKLVFIRSLINIHNLEDRQKLIRIFFKERHSEEERNDLLNELELKSKKEMECKEKIGQKSEKQHQKEMTKRSVIYL